MSKDLKWIIIIFGGGLLLLIALVLAFSFFIFDFGNGKRYSKEDLINNYQIKGIELYQLKDFYNKLVPGDKVVEIEFTSNKEIARLAVTNLNSISKHDEKQYFCEWNLDIQSDKVDSIISALGWTQTTLSNIKFHLDKANCIGVSNGDPADIWFQRSGSGMYSYKLFSEAIPDSIRSQVNGSCSHILYNDKVILEYGSGAVGSDCFPKE